MTGFFTLTGELDGFGGSAAVGYVTVTATPSIIKDGAANRSFVSPKRVWLKDGKFSVALPSDTTSGVSSTIKYRVTSTLRKSADMEPVEFWAPTIGVTVDLSDPVAPVAPPPDPGQSFVVPFTIPFTVGA